MASIRAAPGAQPSPSSDFISGLRICLPVSVAVLPFSLLFGALAAQSGLTVVEATLMSGLIFGGASQMVGIELFGQNIEPWLIVMSILAVNFRHVLYSATFGRRIRHWSAPRKALGFFFLTDVHFAETERRVQAGSSIGFAWFLGLSLGIYIPWVVASAVGAAFGGLLGDTSHLGLDFLLPIYFLGLVLDFHKRPLFLPVVTVSAAASIVAMWTVGSPWHVSIGALAGIALAAAMPPRRADEGPPVGGDVP